MKRAIINFFLGRGLNKLQEIAAKALRHGLTTAGGALVAQGYATGDDITKLQGVTSVVVGILLSVVRTYAAKYLK